MKKEEKRDEGAVIPQSKTKDGKERWIVRVFLHRKNEKRIYKSRTVIGNEKKARVELRKMLAERDNGTLQETVKGTLNEFLDRWMVAHKISVRQQTYDNDVTVLRLYIRPFLGNKQLGKIKPLDIQEVYNSLAQRVSSVTIRRAHSVLHHALEDAVRWEIIVKNPSDYASVPKQQQQKKEKMVLDQKQAKQFISACEMDKNGTFFIVLLTTGLRPSEALGLRWSDVDLIKKTASIKRTLHSNRKGGGYRIEEATKTTLSTRTVVLPNATVDMLKNWHKDQLARMFKSGDKYERNDLIFTSEVGTPLRQDNLVHIFHRVTEDAGIQLGFTMYGLRHTYATLALKAGVPIKVVSENLGHSGIELTLKTYAHVLVGQKDEAAAKLEAFLFA